MAKVPGCCSLLEAAPRDLSSYEGSLSLNCCCHLLCPGSNGNRACEPVQAPEGLNADLVGVPEYPRFALWRALQANPPICTHHVDL